VLDCFSSACEAVPFHYFPPPQCFSGTAYTGVMNSRAKIFLALGLLCAAFSRAQESPKWQIAPFVRPVKGNPVIAPRADSTFIDPILKRPVHWEVLHTFNPAAIVRDGKVYVVYRAEDDSGAMEIGGHTSRLGLAQSADGITIVRRAEQVV
jgi:beta-1,2-mannosidase